MPTFRFTVTKHAAEKEVYEHGEADADDFVRRLSKRGHRVGAKDGSGIIAATFAKDSRLEGKNVETVTGLILDVDGKFRRDGQVVHEVVDPDWFIGLIGFRGVAHTSYNHSPPHPKYRVILPLAEPISPREFQRLWWWMYERVQRKADPSCKNPDRMFYLPRCYKEAQDAGWPWIRELYGPLLSLKAIPDSYQPPEAYRTEQPRKRVGFHTAPRETYRGHVDTAALLDELAELPLLQWAVEYPEALSREVWRGIATNIAAAVVEEDDAALRAGSELFHRISEPDQERYNYSDCEKVWRDALKSAKSHGPMTYVTLINNGAPDTASAGTESKSPVGHAREQLRRKKRNALPKDDAPTSAAAPDAGLISRASVETTSTPANLDGSKPPPPSAPSNSDGGGEEEVFDHSPSEFLYDIENAKWLMRYPSGEWSYSIVEHAFSQILLKSGLPRRMQDSFRAQIQSFDRREPVYESSEVLVVKDGVTVFNTYRPGRVVPAKGNFDDIKALVLNLAGNDPAAYEYVMDWLAAPLQSLKNKGTPLKMGTALVFVGAQGSGKGTLSFLMELLYGNTNVITIGQEALDGRFNGELTEKLFVVANEVMSSSNRSAQTANKIKPWITDAWIPVERKHQELRLERNNFNIIFTSNDDRPVLIEKTDRRYSVFRSKAFSSSASRRIYHDVASTKAQLAAFYDHLLSRSVKIQYGDLFMTEARETMIQASYGSDEKFVQELISEGWYALSIPWVDAAPSGKIREAVVGDNEVLSATLMEVYLDYCRRNGIKSRGRVKLTSTLKAEIPAVEPGKARIGGIQQRVWCNVPLHPIGGEVIPLTPQAPTPASTAAVIGEDADFGDGTA